MKRTSIIAVLGLFTAFASVGCIGQSTSEVGTDESRLVSDRAHNVASSDDPSAVYDQGPARALELKMAPSQNGQGPHPEPWLEQEGPHPEPWQSKNISAAPDPNGGSGSGNGNGKP